MSTNAFIDVTPTWGEWGAIYRRLAESGARKALAALQADFARAMASCEALKRITATLTDEQAALVSKTMASELAKQGF
ncbi:MAG: hypothetical protein JF606_27505 [Burkholderiales bacterium]|nr:hypothetical protein [Burkholderiales bacterium]